MILFIDDEDQRSSRFREALEEFGPVTWIPTAAKALEVFGDPERMRAVRAVVIDLALPAAPGMTVTETRYGRDTGEVLRGRLRDAGWSGPIVVFTNARDDALSDRVHADGDVFLRKPSVLPSELADRIRELLGN